MEHKSQRAPKGGIDAGKSRRPPVVIIFSDAHTSQHAPKQVCAGTPVVPPVVPGSRHHPHFIDGETKAASTSASHSRQWDDELGSDPRLWLWDHNTRNNYFKTKIGK